MNINLHIERLIVDDLGIQPQQRDELKAAVATALRQQLMSQNTVFATQLPASHSSINAGSILAESSHGMEHLGQQVGHAIYGGIRRE